MRRVPDFVVLAAGGYVLAAITVALWPLAGATMPMDLSGRLAAPSSGHLFGTDGLGRDMLVRAAAGARASLSVAASVVAITSVAGIAFGAFIGLIGGRIDRIGATAIDLFLAFPGLLLALALTAVLGPSRAHVILALCVLGWTGYARLARAQTLSLRQEAFVSAAILSGASSRRVLRLHIIPNVLPLALVQMAFGLSGAVLAESTLSFLGLSDPAAPSWGGMLNEGLDYLHIAPHMTLVPGAIISLFILSVNLLGDELQTRLSPRQQALTSER